MKLINIIIITILLFVIIWIATRFLFPTDIVYDLLCDANMEASNLVVDSGLISSNLTTNTNIIGNKEFYENNTSNFMMSVWFYVDNWGNKIANEKNILFMSTQPNATTPPDLKNKLIGISSSVEAMNNIRTPYKNLSVSLDKYENNLLIDIETYADSIEGKSIFTRYLIKNIAIQKWNNLTLAVDTKTLDVYLDGKLRNSFILNGIYKHTYDNNTKKNIYLGNLGVLNSGFQGYITRVRYQPNAIHPQEAYNIYKDGINASLANSLYNKYGLKVSFTEYNNERAGFSI